MKKILCWFLGHVSGYTNTGLPIIPIGSVSDTVIESGPACMQFQRWSKVDDIDFRMQEWERETGNEDLFKTFFVCQRCGEKLVEKHSL